MEKEDTRQIVCTYKKWCCDKMENGECGASEDDTCPNRVVVSTN